ncbi:hypothetical protein ACFV8Z_29230 [Streptomyces sp. NPDC059837]
MRPALLLRRIPPPGAPPALTRYPGSSARAGNARTTEARSAMWWHTP